MCVYSRREREREGGTETDRDGRFHYPCLLLQSRKLFPRGSMYAFSEDSGAKLHTRHGLLGPGSFSPWFEKVPFSCGYDSAALAGLGPEGRSNTAGHQASEPLRSAKDLLKV